MISYLVGVVVTFMVLRGINMKTEPEIPIVGAVVMSLMSWVGLMGVFAISAIVLIERVLKDSELDKWFQSK